MLAGEVVPVDALMRSSFRTESDATRGITTEQNIRGFRFSSNECCDVGLSEFEAMSVLAGPRLRAGDGVSGLRPESCWNDCLTRRKSIRPCVPSHVAYAVGAAGQQTVRSPRTMDPHSQEWHRNREATVYLPASGGEGLGLVAGSEYTNVRKRR